MVCWKPFLGMILMWYWKSILKLIFWNWCIKNVSTCSRAVHLFLNLIHFDLDVSEKVFFPVTKGLGNSNRFLRHNKNSNTTVQTIGSFYVNFHVKNIKVNLCYFLSNIKVISFNFLYKINFAWQKFFTL